MSNKCATNGRGFPGRWVDPVAEQSAACRAGGRRHYNAVRQRRAALRRVRVAELLVRATAFKRGVQTTIARELNVSRATVCRDIRRLHLDWLAWNERRNVD